MQKNETRTPNTIYKIYTKWIKDLNVRSETIKLLQENIGSTLLDISETADRGLTSRTYKQFV